LGDFIILVKLGMSVPKALLFNFASGLSSVLGAVVAVAIGSTQDGATLNRDSGRMLAFSCGMLLYVAFGLMPAMRALVMRMMNITTRLVTRVGCSVGAVSIDRRRHTGVNLCW
jgi:zinc transporter ZupT